MDYNKIKLNAFDDHLLEFRDNQLYDVPHPSEPPYETNRLFTVYIPKIEVESSYAGNRVNDNTVVFSLDPSLYISNATDVIQKIDIDFGRGKKYRNLRFGSEINVKYSDIGSEAIVTLHRKNGEDLSCKCEIITEIKENVVDLRSVEVTSEGCESCSDVFPPLPPIFYQFKFYGAEFGVYFGCQTTSISDIKKPIIILEGWDPLNDRTLDKIYTETNVKIEGDEIFNDGFIPALQNQGFDVILMNFNDGGGDIRGNAMVLREFIKKLNEILVNNESYNKIVVMGESMGGLVARYALSYMESVGEDHNTRLFMTMDTPHQGAYVSYAIQHIGDSALDLINAIRNTWILVESIYLAIPNISMPLRLIRMYLESQIKDIADIQKLFNCTSSKQMLVYYEPDSWDPGHPNPSPARTQFLRDLDRIGNNGYPANVDKMVAFSFGSGADSTQGFEAGDIRYLYDDDLTVTIEIDKETHETRQITILDRLLIKLNAIPDQGRKNIVIVYGEKKVPVPQGFSWLLYKLLFGNTITIPIPVFDLTVEGTLPYESAPGGFYDITTKEAVKFLDGFLKTNFLETLGHDCFVPTVSSLDLKNKTLDYDIYSNLTNDEPYYEVNNHSITPFDAIYVEDKNKEHGKTGTTDNMIKKAFELIVGDENLLLKDLFITDEKAQYEAASSITLENVHVSSSNSSTEKAVLHLKAGETIIFEKDFSIGKNCTFEVVNQGVCE
ncbi:MAG: hypothetical protein JXA77_01240 [Bacteroidales bacterium]|nr:hypothetical protein [Bacteroidales bacterium]